MVRFGTGRLGTKLFAAMAGLIVVALTLGLTISLLEAGGSGPFVVNRAELDNGRLRVEGEGAGPNAVILVAAGVGSHGDLAVGNADPEGRFRVERQGFGSNLCAVKVSELGSRTNVLSGVTLDPCTEEGM